MPNDEACGTAVTARARIDEGTHTAAERLADRLHLGPRIRLGYITGKSRQVLHIYADRPCGQRRHGHLRAVRQAELQVGSVRKGGLAGLALAVVHVALAQPVFLQQLVEQKPRK